MTTPTAQPPSLVRGSLAPLSVSLLALLLSSGCSRPEPEQEAPQVQTAELTGNSQEAAPPEPSSEPEAPSKPALACPESTVLIPAGTFWAGNARETFEQEENPQFQTKVAAFCASPHEVTTLSYEECVAAGACTPAHGAKNKTCNSSEKGRAEHPINCIDYFQAEAVCTHLGLRLPTEIEWEYLARGGEEMRAFPWGTGSPDAHTCWKHHESCPVQSFEPTAFGLYDVGGNVWEWTQDWFTPYPWPAEHGRTKVIRGGSWSRRFEKWLSPSLRNRLDPQKWGSHLGVRCVQTPEHVECPYGQEEESALCRRGVEQVNCLPGTSWNGVRCAPPNSTQRCPTGSEEKPGRGCVRTALSSGAASGEGSAAGSLDLAAVTRTRSPEFDADCQANQPTRPVAYRYSGGQHAARNAAGQRDGCKNRDVGVGWNSACCP